MSNWKGLFSLAFGSDEPSDIEIDLPPQAPTPSIQNEPLSEPTNISVEPSNTPINPRPIVPPVTKPHTPRPKTIPTAPPAAFVPLAALPPTMSAKTELKVALPADFSGKSSDASQWIKAMKAYFALNSTLYSSNEDKVTTTLNKMSEGRGANFAEMWYDKLADPSIPAADKTFNKFAENFETTFYPFDTRATTCLELSKLVQKSTRTSDGITDDGFQKYITDFLNITSKAGITNDITLIDQFSLGLDQCLTIMILSMTPIPTTIKDWIDHAKTFHAQKQRILALRGGCPQISFFVHRSQKDPNAMDIDAIMLMQET